MRCYSTIFKKSSSEIISVLSWLWAVVYFLVVCSKTKSSSFFYIYNWIIWDWLKDYRFTIYIPSFNPTDEELRQLITNMHLFFLKLLTNKELYDAVKEEIYNYLKNLGEWIKDMGIIEDMLEEALFDGVVRESLYYSWTSIQNFHKRT